MKRFRTKNPALAVAVSGSLIVVLIVTAVGASVWRFSAAQDSYNRAAAQSADSIVTLGELRRNIYHRQQAVITFFVTGDARPLGKLMSLERSFDARVVAAQRNDVDGTLERLIELRRLNATVTQLSDRLRAAPTTRPDLGPINAAVNALESGLTRYADAEIDELDQLVAHARNDARAARLFAFIAGLVAALLTIALVLYVQRMLRQLLDEVRFSAGTLNHAVVDMRAAAQESALALAEQSAAVAEVAATAAELSSTAAAIAAGAETMWDEARQTAMTIEDMREQSSGIADRSLELDRSSQEIGEILMVLTDVTERTDLLALNAAIEAAHAGEAGRGFAVVASEIRKLAESSGRSTTSIRDVVTRVQTASNATILATERGTVQTDEVAGFMLRSTADLEEARQAAEQQRAAAEQVAAALSGIRGAVQKLSSEEEARVATTQQVEDLTVDLGRLLQRHGITTNGVAQAEPRE